MKFRIRHIKIGPKECVIMALCVMAALFIVFKGGLRSTAPDVIYEGSSESVKAISACAALNTETGGEPTQRAVESKGKIALTFDDGPHPYYTKQLLDGLKERNVKASFFVLGAHAKEYPELVERMAEEGHLIGNHTYNHVQLTAVNAEQFKEEITSTSMTLEEITGETVEFIRPPFGSWDKRFEEELNMFPVLWTIDPLDWCSHNSDCIVRNVVAKAGENDIILMHDEYKTSVTAALAIVDILQAEGFEFVTVAEILFD